MPVLRRRTRFTEEALRTLFYDSRLRVRTLDGPRVRNPLHIAGVEKKYFFQSGWQVRVPGQALQVAGRPAGGGKFKLARA